MFVYFARPIDQAGEYSFLGTLDLAVSTLLTTANVGAFRPNRAYLANTRLGDHAVKVDTLNRMALFECDALVALLPAGVATLGTPVEIDLALSLDKPVVIFTDIKGSVQVAAWANAGASVVDLTPPDWEPTPEGLRDMLTPLEAANSLTPDLLVKYAPGALRLGRAHSTDAGLDLATLHPWVLRSGSRTLIPTGVFGSVPDGWYGRITGRSSALSKLEVQVHEGIIDAGYTGELMIGATFQGKGHLDLPAGTRLAQYILAPTWDGRVVEVDELPETARGTNGWGSSGE